MNNSPDENTELTGAYVLDALPPEEIESFEAHLADCAGCRAEVAELRQVVDLLPLAIDTVQPSPSLRDRIMAEAALDLKDTPQLTAMPGGQPQSATSPTRRSFARSRDTWLAVAAAAVIAGLGLWNLQLRNDNHGRQTANDRVVAALADHAIVSQVGGTAVSPTASAEVVQPRNGAPAFLVVKGLPPTPSNKVYEVWLMRGGTPYSAGVFSYSGSQAQVVQLPRSANGYSATAVTDEPSPSGSTSPTGKQFLAGKLGA